MTRQSLSRARAGAFTAPARKASRRRDLTAPCGRCQHPRDEHKGKAHTMDCRHTKTTIHDVAVMSVWRCDCPRWAEPGELVTADVQDLDR